MAITTEQIKELRNITGVSIMQCKKALEEAEGDMEKAQILLRKLSKKAADKKADRELGAGAVASYIHGEGAVGSLVELLCETDFVSKNEGFQELAKEIAMHVAASAPEFVRESEIAEEDTVKAKELFTEEVADKPAEMQEQIIEGKLAAYFADKTLMKQPYIKSPDKTVEQLIEEAIQKFGEKVEIGRISRFSISG
jgi:elongation factor Ts